MKTFGLTGGVGMGKSTAAGFFHALGAKLVDTDELARQFVQPGQPALDEIRSTFGRRVIGANGELKRAELARIIFADATARKKLEAILHPRIRERWLAQIKIWRAAPKQSDGGRAAPKRPAATVREHGGSDGGRVENQALAVVVIPLLFETNAESQFDRIICVACSAPAQRQRLLARGWTPEQIRQRLAAQWPVEQKIARAHFVVWTDGSLEVPCATNRTNSSRALTFDELVWQFRLTWAHSHRRFFVAAGILPAVEPGRPARRIKRPPNQSGWKISEPRPASVALSGRRDARPLRQTRRLPLHQRLRHVSEVSARRSVETR